MLLFGRVILLTLVGFVILSLLAHYGTQHSHKMAKKGKKASTPKKKANGYKLPPPIPPGEIIHNKCRKWKIGPSIGVGGFGEIYSAYEYKEGESPPDGVSDYPYVVKIEPIDNGPLFVEMHFYSRNGDRKDIERFMKSRNLSQLGMPTYCDSGSHMVQDEELRFLVLERYGKDLWKTFNEVGRKFPAPTVFQLGLQMLDVLDYVHSRSYVHADIKGANILMGIKEGSENQAYLLDYGLAFRIVEDNYKPDPKSAHEGTIEYTSTDRHVGAKTMRGDLEILGYNLLQWLIGELPWEKVLEDPKKVHKMKTDFMNNVRTRIETDYPDVPDELIEFFEYIKTLEPKDRPDYTVCRHIFDTYLTSVGKTKYSQIEFTTTISMERSTATNQSATSDGLRLNRDPKNIIELKDSEEHGVSNKIRKSTEVLDARRANTTKNIRLPSPRYYGNVTPTNSQSELKKNIKQIATKNNKTESNEDKNPEIISIPESDSKSEPISENYKEVVKINQSKRIKDKNAEVISLTESDSMSGLDINQEQEVRKKPSEKKDNASEIILPTKKNKKKKNDIPDDTPLAENDANMEQLADNQDQKVTKNKKSKIKTYEYSESERPDENQECADIKSKKNKKKRNENSDFAPPAESDAEVEQLDDSQEHKVTKNKKSKKKRDKNSEDISTVEIDTVIERPDENQECADIKSKKNKKKRNENSDFAPPAENDADMEQLDDSQKHKVTKNKKSKKKRDKNSEDISTAEIVALSERPDENQEQADKKAKKNKNNRDKNFTVTPSIENIAESEQLDDNQEQKAKNKKNIKNKGEKFTDTLPLENDDPKKESDVNQEEKVTTTKRNKRQRDKNAEVTPQAENNPDDNQEDKNTKKNKKRRDNSEVIPAENNTETGQPEDNQEQEVTKKKRRKRKNGEKPEIADVTESQVPDDNQPTRKKRKCSVPTVLTSKDKKTTRIEKYPDPDSESEFMEKKTRKKKRKRINYNEPSQLRAPALPSMKADTAGSPIDKRLRSYGKKLRPNYA